MPVRRPSREVVQRPKPAGNDRLAKENAALRLENAKLKSAIEHISRELESHTTAAVMNAQHVQGCYEAFEGMCEEQKLLQQKQLELLEMINKRLEAAQGKAPV